MFVASARNVNRNPVTRAAAEAVARRVARQERAERMAAQAQEDLTRAQPLEADARARRRKARPGRIERFLERAPRILASPADLAMLRLIAARVCRFHGVGLADLCSRRRDRHLVLARQCVCYWARRLTGLSFSRIGYFLGNRTKPTIIKAERAYRQNASRARAARRKARKTQAGDAA